MDKLLIAPAFLRLLKEGRFFRPVFTWFLRLQAALALVGGIVWSINLWKLASGEATATIFGLLVLQLCLAVSIYLCCHLSWLRAVEVGGLEGQDATPLALARLLLKLGGELAAALLAPLSLGGCLLIWISSGSARDTLASLFGPLLQVQGGDAFTSGLALLALGLAWAAGWLLGAYALSEFLGLFPLIERNTRKG